MRPQDREWPAWHPNNELKAQHLLGLEDFLFARAGLADEDAHGIEDLDWRTGVTFEDADDSLVVRIKGLRGVTPAGEPVDVPLDPPLQAAVPGDRGRSSEVVVDLWIDVNARLAPSDSPEVANPPKMVLRVATVTLDVNHPLSLEETHSLYLGRYKWVFRRKEHELVHRPLVRRLGSFAPHDAAWDAWVQPLRSRIETVLVGAEQRVSRGETAQILLAGEAARLAFEWPALPLPALARRLRLLSWLDRRAEKADLRPVVEEALLSFSVASGEQAPETLARLLPIRTVGGGPFTIKDGIGDLLRAVGAVGGVDYHAPGRLLSRWADELGRLLPRGGATGEAQELRREVEEILAQELSRGAPGIWTRGVALLTAAACEASFREPFPRQLIGACIPSGLDVARGAASVLSELYKGKGEAQSKRAGPLAFYWLAQVAARIPEVAGAVDESVAGYLRAVAGGDVSLGSQTNRALPYLKDRVATPPAAPGATGPALWQPGESPRRDSLRHLSTVRVVVMGPTGSGKTALVRYLAAALASPAAARLAARLTLAASSSGAEGDRVALAKGEVKILGRILPLTVEEIPGALLDAMPSKPRAPEATGSAPYNVLRDCDLLVVTLDPLSALGAEASSPTIVNQVQALKWALSYKPTLAVAVAYTKADEYGVVSPQAVRLVEGKDQCDALRKVAAGDASAWETLLGSPRTDSLDSRLSAPNAVVTWRGVPTPKLEAEWSMTRGKLLEQTRPLWESLLRAAQPSPLLNGYFVAAEPCDRVFEPLENRGLLPLFADFLAYLSGGL